MNGTPIAAFDFDGTLIRRDSMPVVLRHLLGRWGVLRLGVRHLPTLVGFLTKRIPNDVAKSRILGEVLRGRAPAEIEAAGEQLAAQLPRLLRPEAAAKLAWHLQAGHRVCLVSATLELYLRPCARALGISVVLGTRLVEKDGVLTGVLHGPNCWGAEKYRRLAAYYPDVAQAELYAYGDSAGDKQLLAAAQHSFYRTF